MGARFDRWTLLKLVELVLVTVCLTFKRVTDDEASRLFLYLQKLSREWSLLNNVTWSKVGAAVADATYGGYLIITAAFFCWTSDGGVAHSQENNRIYITWNWGHFIHCAGTIWEDISLVQYGGEKGSLSFAALDSVPPDLVDNAAIVGTVSLVTGALFLLDMGGPKAKKPSQSQTKTRRDSAYKPSVPRSISQQVHDIEKGIQNSERKHLDVSEPKKLKKEVKNNGIKNGRGQQNDGMVEMEPSKNMKG
ncbi:hypothetical protein NQ314_009095 [Rhamnusium bicolor]|uniref:Uncharacterized protein n=1 Tax=Rhamnusium bicolor TaxID=1586634 RepID=A0AAV8Y2R4_9CUCU|nr:hypothetical protein NQ314_009095 [Rhamnusium bicolor]